VLDLKCKLILIKTIQGEIRGSQCDLKKLNPKRDYANGFLKHICTVVRKIFFDISGPKEQFRESLADFNATHFQKFLKL
jgi:hypothetical protein